MFSLSFLLALLLNFNNVTTYPLPKDVTIHRVVWLKDNEIVIETIQYKDYLSRIILLNPETGKFSNEIIDEFAPELTPPYTYDRIFITDEPDCYALYNYNLRELCFVRGNELIKSFSLKEYGEAKNFYFGRNEFQIIDNKGLIAIYARLIEGELEDHHATFFHYLLVYDKSLKTLDLIDIGNIKFHQFYAIDSNDKILGFEGSTVYRYDIRLKKMVPLKTFSDGIKILAVKSIGDKYYVAYSTANKKTADLGVYDTVNDSFTVLEHNLYDYYLGKNSFAFLKMSENQKEVGFYITNDFRKKRLLKTYLFSENHLIPIMSPSEDKLALLVMYEYVDIFDISDL